MTHSKAAITPFENDKSGNVGSGSWAPWVWSSEDRKYYTFRRAGLTIEYKWLPIGQVSEYRYENFCAYNKRLAIETLC